MKNFGKAVVALRIPILIVSVLLLIPAALGYIRTRTNYDVLSYLKDKTVIVISHRFNNKKCFDRVLKLENGKIYES